MKYEMKEILFLFSVSYSSNPDPKVTGIGIDRNFPFIQVSCKNFSLQKESKGIWKLFLHMRFILFILKMLILYHPS